MESANGYHNEDVGNILLMEHVNVRIPDQGLATLFYVVGLGFTRDPDMMVGLNNMWLNLGEQQFHVPTGAAQVLPGHIGLVIPDLDALERRLEAIKPGLEGTKYTWSREDGYIAATCPWGNQFRCYAPDARFGSITRGVPYVEFLVDPGTAEGIARFYQRALKAPATAEGGVARVQAGTYQELVYRESDEPRPEYDGHHIAVYILNFSEPFEFMRERELVSEDVRNHQFRFVNIVDPDSGKPLHKIEHEVRGARHALYRRPLANRTAEQMAVPISIPVPA
jgi:hypothetical protein